MSKYSVLASTQPEQNPLLCVRYLNQESHHLWGKRYLLRVTEGDQVPSVEIQLSWLLLQVRPETTGEKKQEIFDHWYRD